MIFRNDYVLEIIRTVQSSLGTKQVSKPIGMTKVPTYGNRQEVSLLYR